MANEENLSKWDSVKCAASRKETEKCKQEIAEKKADK